MSQQIIGIRVKTHLPELEGRNRKNKWGLPKISFLDCILFVDYQKTWQTVWLYGDCRYLQEH
jgi:hypothetical protein